MGCMLLGVLILVVVEDVLVHGDTFINEVSGEEVLILVVVEDVLVLKFANGNGMAFLGS